MNETPEIVPHKITKPIQLLAAWLAGLVLVNASFLTAASLLHSPTWLPAFLTIAAVINVPLFIASLFLLQTKFRPEMQEDTYYSKYLEHKYSNPSPPIQPVDTEAQLSRLAKDIVEKVTAKLPNKQEEVVRLLKKSEVEQMVDRFMNNRALSELYFYPQDWASIYDIWRNDADFKQEIAALSTAGLIIVPDGSVRDAKLSSLGKSVAKRLESQSKLWNQQRDAMKRHESDLKDMQLSGGRDKVRR